MGREARRKGRDGKLKQTGQRLAVSREGLPAPSPGSSRENWRDADERHGREGLLTPGFGASKQDWRRRERHEGLPSIDFQRPGENWRPADEQKSVAESRPPGLGASRRHLRHAGEQQLDKREGLPHIGASSENAEIPASSKLDGRWTQKRTDERILIRGGCVITVDDLSIPITAGNSSSSRSNHSDIFVMGARHAKLAGDDLVWDDGEIWVLESLDAAELAGAAAARDAKSQKKGPQAQAEAAARAAEQASVAAGLSFVAQARQAARAAAAAAAAAGRTESGDANKIAKDTALARSRHGARGQRLPDNHHVVRLFRTLDEEDRGKLTKRELVGALQKLNPAIFTAEACDKLFQHMTEGGGVDVDLALFCDWMYGESDRNFSWAMMEASVPKGSRMSIRWDSPPPRIDSRIFGQWVHQQRPSVVEVIEPGDEYGKATILTAGNSVPIDQYGKDVYHIQHPAHAGLISAKLSSDGDKLVWDDGDVWIRAPEEVAAREGRKAEAAAAEAGLDEEEQAQQAKKAAIWACVSASGSARYDKEAIAEKVSKVSRDFGRRSLRLADVDKVKQVFEKSDTNHDDKMSFFEMQSLFQRINPKVFTEENCMMLFKSMDRDNNGTIDFGEFCGFVYADELPGLQHAMLSSASTRQLEDEVWSASIEYGRSYENTLFAYLGRTPQGKDIVRTRAGKEITFAELKSLPRFELKASFPIQVRKEKDDT